jgi:hypothetical protein
MITYQKCKDLFETARNKENGKPIANNTRLLKEGDDFIIRLHRTDIVRINPENVYTVNTGGWQTVTTKERLNRYLPIDIYQEKHVWYYFEKDPDRCYFDWKNRKEYFEGLQCNKEGKVINPPAENEEKETAAKRKKLNSMVRKYIKGYIDDIKKNGLGEPSNEDCFGCLFQNAETGIVRGGMHENECMGFDHYIEHFKEGYYPRSLLLKAIVEKGYNNPGFIWSMGCIDFHFKKTLQWFFNRRKAELIKHI